MLRDFHGTAGSMQTIARVVNVIVGESVLRSMPTYAKWERDTAEQKALALPEHKRSNQRDWSKPIGKPDCRTTMEPVETAHLNACDPRTWGEPLLAA